jgi:hypothetical protein
MKGARNESAPFAKVRPADCKAPSHGFAPLEFHPPIPPVMASPDPDNAYVEDSLA